MTFLKLFILFVLSCLSITFATHPDEVQDLPGLSFGLNYKHYSGYLNATSGRYLHYWFVESQGSPSKDPLLLWLNGGPGCSSLDGLLSELGPLHVSADGKSLYNNTYSWNRIANVLFLEAPAGVGFSYADNKKYIGDDDSTSYDNYIALQHFFQKFPQFKKNDFYITGESYAGIYIPTLSVRVLTGPATINFKGFAIGNGLLDEANRTNSIVFFAYYHGLVGIKLWNSLSQYCCNGIATPQTCNFANPDSSDCRNAVKQVLDLINGNELNFYNLYADCANSSEKISRYLVDKRNLMRLFPKLTNVERDRLKDYLPCIDTSNIRKYLNTPAVRAALHIPTKVQEWEVCSTDVENGYTQIYNSTFSQVLQLVNSGKLKGLIYNGDVDMAANFLGDEWFADNLGFEVLADFKPWKFNDQIAGFVKSYKNLSYLTIKGSGHMVPQDKPGPAFKMIDSFLNNKPY